MFALTRGRLYGRLSMSRGHNSLIGYCLHKVGHPLLASSSENSEYALGAPVLPEGKRNDEHLALPSM